MDKRNNFEIDFSDKHTRDALYQKLEDDEEFLMETLGVALNLVISDPKLNIKVANLITDDFSPLYMAIMVRIGKERQTDSSLSCCKDIV